MKKAAIFILAFLPIVASAQFGVLDNDFDADGILQLQVDNYQTAAKHVLVQPDGKILVCGSASTDLGFVYRLFPDGSLDNSFGVNGRVVLTSNTSRMALLANGHIILAGDLTGQQSGAGIIAYRLDASGEPDASFGNGAFTVADFPNATSATLRDVEIAPDGKIVLVGSVSQQDLDVVVVRLNADGTIDQSFSFDGQVITDISVGDYGQAAVIGNDGKITVAGSYYIEQPGDFASLLIRYNTDGTLDQTFGSNGFVQVDISTGLDEFYNLTSDGAGNLYACGTMVFGGSPDMMVARFLPNGALDGDFGLGGAVPIDFNTQSDRAWDILVQPDSRILVMGESMNNGIFQPSGFRLMPNGTEDNTFGNGGAIITQVGSEGQFNAVALQADLKILAAGSSFSNATKALITRYTSGMNVGIGEIDAYIGSTLVYPNPITDNTVTVEYELTADEAVSIELFNVAGHLISTLQSEIKEVAGSYKKSLSIGNVSSGNYLLRLNTDKGAVTVKVSVN